VVYARATAVSSSSEVADPGVVPLVYATAHLVDEDVPPSKGMVEDAASSRRPRDARSPAVVPPSAPALRALSEEEPRQSLDGSERSTGSSGGYRIGDYDTAEYKISDYKSIYDDS